MHQLPQSSLFIRLRGPLPWDLCSLSPSSSIMDGPLHIFARRVSGFVHGEISQETLAGTRRVTTSHHDSTFLINAWPV